VAGEGDGKGEKSEDVDYVGARGSHRTFSRARNASVMVQRRIETTFACARETGKDQESVSDPSPLRATEMAEITEGSEAGKRGIVRLVISCNI